MSTVNRYTPLLHIETNEYPLFISDVKARLPNTCFPAEVHEDLLLEFGYVPVQESEKPQGDVVKEIAPKEVDGVFYRQWETRDFNDEETSNKLKQEQDQQLSRIATFQSQEFAKGFPYEFEGTVYHIQTRFSDRSNIDSLHTMAEKMKAAGREDVVFEFRTWENISIKLTPQQMIDLAETTFVQVSAAYKRVWEFKDAVNDAKSVEDFPLDYKTLFNE